MFKRILIANRGEIACRVIKTARRMGITTIAVYSDADRNALHVEMADQAIHIGPAMAAQSYLAIDRIVEACLKSGAEAVHPGYGFLSERAEFADALVRSGIAFIGPNPRAIAAMGDKIEAKIRAAEAGVSIVPGFPGEIPDARSALAAAQQIGFPVILKASAGGGGKGMRIARTPAEVEEGFERARSEAMASFGDDRILIEKFISNPRHIEIQVLGDKHGQVIHLGERECSIQRRNQKVIEEAPSPLLDSKTRAAMGAEAVALAMAVGYDSAGTVEFVAGQDSSYYFLEMNTRLQVEHPVTELVTGVDLVEQMIRVAAGEPLKIHQKDIKIAGWAVESRIYAEDPVRGFVPSTGRLISYKPPRESCVDGVTVRNDTGVTDGSEITIHYDPLIAKLITYAPTRQAAIDAQVQALDGFHIAGLRHNIAFLSEIMCHPRWQAGDLSTSFIAEEFSEGFKPRAPDEVEAVHLCAVAAAIDNLSNLRRREITQQLKGKPVKFSNRRIVMLGRNAYPVEVSGGLLEPCEVTFLDAGKNLSGKVVVRSEWWPGQPIWQGEVGTSKLNIQVAPAINGIELSYRGIAVTARVYTRGEADLVQRLPERTPHDTSRLVVCPMPGVVRAIHVNPGQEVRAGDPLAVVEAMKMENILRAERDGRIRSVKAVVGDNLPVDHVIIEFE